MFWLRVPLLLLVCCTTRSCWAQKNASLTSITVLPCSGSHTQDVSLYSSDIYTVIANLSLCPDLETNGTVTFRVFTYGVGNSTYPLVFSVRQRSNVVSWTIPLQPTGFTSTFHYVNRTLCATNLMDMESSSPLFYVDVFSSSREPLSYNISFEPVKNFSLELHTPSTVVVGAASPQVFYFKFPDNLDTVTVQAQSDSARCAIISVQNTTCPTNDLFANALSKGVYQTMTTDGFLTIDENQVKDREFLLVLITTNFSVCHGDAYKPLEPFNPPNTTDDFEDQYEQTITVTVGTLPSVSQYWLAISIPVIVFLVAGYPLILLLLCGLSRIPTFNLSLFSECCYSGCKKCDIPTPESGGIPTPETESGERKLLLPKTQGHHGREAPTVSQRHSTVNEGASENSWLETSAINKPEASLRLTDLTKNDYKKLRKRYRVYSWNTITVGIFYGLPAFQLVFSEQQIFYASGNEDRCYYNFKCARPLGVLSAFNNVWSNFGYLALGILFFFIVAFRSHRYTQKRKKDENYVQNHGITEYFGIYYAMALALCMEGFMSAFYHICPTNANFQFDTAFMFIIGGLILVKVFQNRHPDIHANAFIAFFSFAVVIFFTLIGIYTDRQNPLAVRLTLGTIVMILIVVFFISFYYFHQWKCPTVCKTLSWDMIKHPRELCSTVKTMCSSLCSSLCSTVFSKPAHKCRFVKLLAGTIINLLLAIAVVTLNGRFTFATSVLAFFLVNVIYFLLIYVVQKFWYKEPWTIHPFIFVVLLGLFWGGALYFYFSAVTSWQKTPAESRQLNKDCILLHFYDNHDIWHFLSASAMFCTFMFVLTLDDGLAKTDVKDIHPF